MLLLYCAICWLFMLGVWKHDLNIYFIWVLFAPILAPFYIGSHLAIKNNNNEK